MDTIGLAPLAPLNLFRKTSLVINEPEPVVSEGGMKKKQPIAPAAHQPASPISPDDPLFTPQQASAYFGGVPTPKTLEYYRSCGTGPDFIPLARRIFYRRSALDAYLDRCTRTMKRAPHATQAA